MKISTKGRYALRVMAELANHSPEEFVPLKEIAGHQEISEKYLEAIMKNLVKAGLVSGVRGKGGGYRLARRPEECTLRDILEVTEGSLAPVACLETEENACERCGTCPTLDFWTGLYAVVNDYVDRFTLADLVREELAKGGETPASPET